MDAGSVIAGRYRLERLLGQGGMGTTWEGIDLTLNRRVAIKQLLTRLQERDELISRFQREAAAAARLRDPHIVTVHDFGVHDGQPYIVMELVPGENLETVLRREGRLDPARAVKLAVRVCRALMAAHGAGIIHRDIKPSNLIVTSDAEGGEQLVLLDFGIAKIREAGRSMFSTAEGQLIGTPAYMAPEQASGRRDLIGPTTDLWQLAITLFQMVAGRGPIKSESVIELLARIVNEPAPRLSALVPSVSPELDDLVARCLAKRQEDRYQSARDLRDALMLTPEARRPPAPRSSRPFSLPESAPLPMAPPANTLRMPTESAPATETRRISADITGAAGAGYGESLAASPARLESFARAPARRLWRRFAGAGMALVSVSAAVTLAVLVSGWFAKLPIAALVLGTVVVFLARIGFNAARVYKVSSGGSLPHLDVTQLPAPSPVSVSAPTVGPTHFSPVPAADPASQPWNSPTMSIPGVPATPAAPAATSNLAEGACSRCGKTNPNHYKFCLGCGAELLPEGKAGRPFAASATPPGPADGVRAEIERYADQAGLRVATGIGPLLRFEAKPGARLPRGQFAAFLGNEAEALAAPQRNAPAMKTVMFEAEASPLYSWPGSASDPHYVLLPLHRPPTAGVFRAWHDLAQKFHVHVLSVSPNALRSAVSSERSADHLRGLVHRAHRNPFELEGPITNELDFFGSRHELALRLQEIASENSGFGLFGLEKWGTTSMLLRLRAELGDRIAAWVDLAALSDLTPATVVSAVGRDFARDLAAKTGIEWAARGAGTSSPADELLQLVPLCRNAGLAVPPIIFVDRVDELTRLAHSNPAAVIELVRTLYAVSSPARGHDRLLLVVAGSDDDFLSRQDFEIERGRVRNPFWRSMNTHYSPFLGPEETYEFLERLGALAGLTFERAALEEAHRQTGGHKYVTRLLGTELCRDRNATPIDTGRLESAISAMVTRHNDYFSAILAHAPHETGDLLRQVAAAPSSHTELLQLGNSLPARAGGPLAALQFALNYRLIQLRDSRYELTMGLLGTWLNYTEGEAARRQPAAH